MVESPLKVVAVIVRGRRHCGTLNGVRSVVVTVVVIVVVIVAGTARGGHCEAICRARKFTVVVNLWVFVVVVVALFKFDLTHRNYRVYDINFLDFFSTFRTLAARRKFRKFRDFSVQINRSMQQMM